MQIKTTTSVTCTTEVEVTDGPVIRDDYTGGFFLVTAVIREVTSFEDGEMITNTRVRGWKCSESGKVYAQRSYQDVCGEASDAFAEEVLS